MSQPYIPPSQGGGGGTSFGRPMEVEKTKLNYICGDCGLNSSQHQTTPFLRCKDCGCRILYKERTKSSKHGDPRGL